MSSESVTFCYGRRIYIYGLGNQDVGYIGYTTRGHMVVVVPSKRLKLTILGVKGAKDVRVCTNRKCMGEVIDNFCSVCGQGYLEV